ncbi:hypothetical protein G7Y89_g5656 [Cudoniella acicularis]|uniref:Protein kinase domain-containing protein n=1 Tax=Cudoniella acicularis TaxID=354080 RepID=A0A8H4RQA4_9HELO|nr:hypothetical protein G7Y89_g5656 [Cudoniella acicularis]
MADTSIIRTATSFSRTTNEAGLVPEATRKNVVQSHFLTVSNLIMGCGDITFYRELTPISGLDTIGDGLSFIVKRSGPGIARPVNQSDQLEDLKVSNQGGQLKALKVSKARLLPTSKAYDDPKTEAHRFRALLTECRVLSHPPLRAHPNIVTLQEVAWAPDLRDMESITACLVMEYADYGTLADLQSYGPIHSLEYSTKKKLCLDVAEGLQALHACGIVHGDVKSENVLVFKHPQREYQAKLSDFGCSIVTGDFNNTTSDITTRLAGFTLGYQAPESAGSMPANQLHLTDAYSFGMLMWRVLVDGQEPMSTFFDLPAEAIERQKKITQIQEMGVFLAGVVVATIEQVVGSLGAAGAGEENLLLGIFYHTLAIDPSQRNLEEVVRSLRRSVGVDEHQSSISMFPLRPLTENDLPMPRSVEFLAILGKPLQTSFFKACEDVTSQCRELLKLEYSDDIDFLIFKFLYVILLCQVSGVGCERNPHQAFETLFEMSQLKSFRSEKASAILLNLRDALGATIKEDLAGEIFSRTLHAAGNEAIPALAWIKQHAADALHHLSYINLHTKYLSHMHRMAGAASSMQSETDAVAIIESSLKNSNVNKPIFENGNTLLHAASLFGSVATLEILTEISRRDECSKCGRGDTASHCFHAWSILDCFALVGPEYVEDVLDLLLKRDVKIPEYWCNDALNALNTNDFAFRHTIHGDGMMRAIGTKRLDVVKALTTLCMKDPNYATKDLQKFYGGAILTAAVLHCWEILKLLLSLISERYLETQKRRLGSDWRVNGGSSLLREVLSASYTLDRITIHGGDFRHAAEKTLEMLDEFGFIEPLLYFGKSPKSTIVSALDTGDEILALKILETTAGQESVNVPDPETGFTPLHNSIRTGSKAVFSRLIELGADVNLTGNYLPGNCLGMTNASYLHACASHGADVFFAEEILKAGVPVDIPDHNNNSALHLALLRRAYNLVRLLLQRGDDLNRIVDGEWSVMGTLLLMPYRRHYYDFLGTMRFLFELDDPIKRPDFIICPAKRVTLLHVAVETEPNPQDDRTGPTELQLKRSTFDALTSLILEFYPSPEQINAKTSKGLTALHIAIMNRNLSGVQLLLEHGADPMLPPPESIAPSTLELSRKYVLLYGNQVLMRGQIPRFWREHGKRSTTISRLIYNAGQWPNESAMWPTIAKLYDAVEPFLGQMRMIGHEDAKRIAMQTTVHKIVLGLANVPQLHTGHRDEESIFKAILEYQEHVNNLLQPWFMAEARMEMRPLPDETEGLKHNFNAEAIMYNALANVPWLAFFGSMGIQEIQQAALFDVILRDIEESQQRGFNEEDEWRKDLVKYLKSRKPADLPISPLLVKYPHPLKYIYEGFLKMERFPFSGVKHVLACLRFMDAGAHPEKFSRDDPPPMSAEEFRSFHLQTLQGNALRIERLRPTLAVAIKCACHNDKIPKIPLRILDKWLKPKTAGYAPSKENHQAREEDIETSGGTSEPLPLKEDSVVRTKDRDTSEEVSSGEDNYDTSAETEHFGIFCASRSCAPKIWTNTFIKGSVKKTHTHPQLYVHRMYPYEESEFSLSEYEKMHKNGKSIEQTVWGSGKLKENGKIELEGNSRHKAAKIDRSEYSLKEFAVIVEKGMKSKGREDNYPENEEGVEGDQDEDEEKEKLELVKTMLRWTALRKEPSYGTTLAPFSNLFLRTPLHFNKIVPPLISVPTSISIQTCDLRASAKEQVHKRDLILDPEKDLEDKFSTLASCDASMQLSWFINLDGYSILAACGPHEEAGEIELEGEEIHRALSYFLLRILKEDNGLSKNHKVIYNTLCAQFRKSEVQQSPVLYGNKGQGFFGYTNSQAITATAPMIEKEAAASNYKRARHMVSQGDLVVFKVTKAGALLSDIERLDTTATSDQIGWTAAALTLLSLQRFPIRLASSLEHQDEWLKALRERSLSVSIDMDSDCGDLFTFYIKMNDNKKYEVLSESYQKIINIPTMSQHQTDISQVFDIIEHLARFRQARDLTNNVPRDHFIESFRVRITSRSGKAYSPECLIEVEDGEKEKFMYQLRIKNILRGTYENIPPQDNGQEFVTGKSWKVKTKVPAEMRENGYRRCEGIAEVFITSKPTSIDLLELPELSTPVKKRTTSRARREEGNPSSEDWMALDFLIRTSLK